MHQYHYIFFVNVILKNLVKIQELYTPMCIKNLHIYTIYRHRHMHTRTHTLAHKLTQMHTTIHTQTHIHTLGRRHLDCSRGTNNCTTSPSQAPHSRTSYSFHAVHFIINISGYIDQSSKWIRLKDKLDTRVILSF